jgi:hypothetical protein
MSDVACENGHVYFVISHDTLDIHNLYTLNATTGAFENVVDVGPAAPGAGRFSRGGFAVAASGDVYYSGLDALWCISAAGSLRYSTSYSDQPGGYYGNPVIAPDGMVFVSDGAGIRSYFDTGGGFLPNFSWAGGMLAGAGLAGKSLAIRDRGLGQYDV